ncbi:MAG: polysaccharide deacetylase family protein [Candidatus Cloacimonetes bacterium]|nr:polysaccharide deacetylase family protein [Candidatus Cloacimonadota bacterium]
MSKSGFNHILRKFYKNKIIIIMYHNFYDENHKKHTNVGLDISCFEKQLQYLRTYYNPISLHELVNYIQNEVPIPENAAVLTFDDGYMNNYTLAFPLLEKYQIPATIFMTMDFIYNSLWIWVNALEYIISKASIKHFSISIPDRGLVTFTIENEEEKAKVYKQLKEMLKEFHPSMIDNIISELKKNLNVKIGYNEVINYQMLDESTIKKMSSPLVDFGSHTLSHPILTRLNTEEVIHEIKDSKEILERILGEEVEYFCYPNGDYNEEIVAIVKEHYKAALSTDSGFVDKSSNIFLLPRIAAKADFDHFVWSLVHPET